MKGDPLNIYGSVMHVGALCNHVEAIAYLLGETEAHDPEYSPVAMVSSIVNYGAMNVYHVCARSNAVETFELMFTFLKELGLDDSVLG